MNNYYKISARPVACKENQIIGEKYRITLMTDCLVRLEYVEDGCFEDAPTQTVLTREFPPVEYTLSRKGDTLIITTSRMTIQYDERPFSASGLTISLHGGVTSHAGDWHYGDRVKNLKGTARTLDTIDGDRVTLNDGVLSTEGYAVMDDSGSLLLQSDGWVKPRKKGIQDLYFFGYGHDYLDAVKDFYKLCGATPLLPRYALGNWWSRFHQYTQQEYLDLMERFKKEKVPLSVAVIDMDWHLVDIDPKYGNGWTGFTWNKELFPDHIGFMKELHQMGLHTTLNLHPADGIRAYEDAYPELAKKMKVNAEQEEPVRFDPSDPEFLQCYYEDVLNPMEAEGVDFWWVDWQQGAITKIENLDSLWILNHYGYLDGIREGKRGLILSRYAGPGSHRYPVGFSGDTIVTWDSLRFQPYFTSTASNIGYGWWSHDIGGHMNGYKNDELTTRWVQYGVFSPIMRLHSSCSEFNSKEPWRFKPEAENAIKEALRLRHKLIPYLYTMNYRSHAENLPLIMPLYYRDSNVRWAYEYKNEYYFGSELLVLPITSPRIQSLNMAKENLYLPEGVWYDFFSNKVYRGGRAITVYRSIEEIPVFARAGAIVPLTNEEDANKNPEELYIKAFVGDDGSFVLYEDDGVTLEFENGCQATTTIELLNGKFLIHAVRGNAELIPRERSYVIELIGCAAKADEVFVTTNGKPVSVKVETLRQGPTVKIEVEKISTELELEVEFRSENIRPHNEMQKNVFELLDKAQIEFDQKDMIYQLVMTQSEKSILLSELYEMGLEKNLYGALMEQITAYDE